MYTGIFYVEKGMFYTTCTEMFYVQQCGISRSHTYILMYRNLRCIHTDSQRRHSTLDLCTHARLFFMSILLFAARSTVIFSKFSPKVRTLCAFWEFCCTACLFTRQQHCLFFLGSHWWHRLHSRSSQEWGFCVCTYSYTYKYMYVCIHTYMCMCCWGLTTGMVCNHAARGDKVFMYVRILKN